ncbi:ComGF family competence protein [Pontibacillus sp. ALD_SL1]|uniref:ComGF family competence protein n=1 Tax=Pontibacillus sp. ALD_SL1 TaxID=2777185 RepID=UPI001A959FA5|nr:ComGF family competence protein [Pontibacillus sp. ALD_SL1]QSS98945.1 ComGF family competence protein [Pontibacillus sp. ALD_SL1]
MKIFAFTYLLRGDRGFTMIEALFALMITLSLSFMLPVMMQVISTTYTINFVEDAKIHQFFLFVQEELYHTQETHLTHLGIQFVQHNGKVITIEQSGSNIIRQVNNTGQERLLFDVKEFNVKQSNDYITLHVELLGGEQIEKHFRLFKQSEWLHFSPLIVHHPFHTSPYKFLPLIIC